MLAWEAFSGGWIAEQNWQPHWVLNEHGSDSSVIKALEALGVSHVERPLREDDRRAAMIYPNDHGALLGRVLHVLGAPIGKKSQLEDVTLPWYLADAPDSIRESLVRIYLENRGYPDETSACIQIIETREPSYLDALAAVIEDVAGEPVRFGGGTITLSADAVRSLGLEQPSPAYPQDE